MSKTYELPLRSEVALKDTWDLTPIFASHAEWENAFVAFSEKLEKVASYKGTLTQSAESLL